MDSPKIEKKGFLFYGFTKKREKKVFCFMDSPKIEKKAFLLYGFSSLLNQWGVLEKMAVMCVISVIFFISLTCVISLNYLSDFCYLSDLYYLTALSSLYPSLETSLPVKGLFPPCVHLQYLSS